MKVSSLIKGLQKVLDQHGDIRVEIRRQYGTREEDIPLIAHYDLEGFAVATWPEEREGKKVIHAEEKVVVFEGTTK